VIAGVMVDDDELVAHTRPSAQRVKNLRADPRVTAPDGEIRKDGEEYRRRMDHPREAVWAVLTEPRRLATWQHPVKYLSELKRGATIHAQLNPQMKAIALGTIIQVDPLDTFAFRWTTSNPMLPPDFTMSHRLEDTSLMMKAGPFSIDHGVVPLTASMHIHRVRRTLWSYAASHRIAKRPPLASDERRRSHHRHVVRHGIGDHGAG
jgi:uncharacterized protein YndB with AHSA1/START domain